jgi:glucosyl-3-phosphoglycerate synthase
MADRTRSWFSRRTSRWPDWPPERVLDLKQRRGSRISVVIAARNEERTVAGVVGAISRALMTELPLVDELVVMDSDSTDATAAVAAEAGATVYPAREVASGLGTFPGKGEALWKSLLVTKGDLLVFVDADLTRWGPHFVTGLLGPLLADEQVQLVKGFYTRVRTETDGSTSTEGGRVTELVARPLISLWWPELADVVQPLAGEWAARRSLMESLSVPVGYGVELATLMDTVAGHGLDAVAQVDLGSRAHRHQADHDLALMAAELLVVAERRRSGGQLPDPALLRQFVRDRKGQVRQVSRPVPVHERPPVASVPVAAGGGPSNRGPWDRGPWDRGPWDRGPADRESADRESADRESAGGRP